MPADSGTYDARVARLVPLFCGYDTTLAPPSKSDDLAYVTYRRDEYNDRGAPVLCLSAEGGLSPAVISDWCDQMGISLAQFGDNYEKAKSVF